MEGREIGLSWFALDEGNFASRVHKANGLARKIVQVGQDARQA